LLHGLLDELSGEFGLRFELLSSLFLFDVYPEIQREAQPPPHVVARDELMSPHGFPFAGVVVPPGTLHVPSHVVGDGVVHDEEAPTEPPFL